ncbi:MAG: flavodoxin family protein [Abditibacteriota bacterium]|nr:flavodoxin family protein [Abditibacteriota bacterium]
MKTIVINGSPRKVWNTAKILKSAMKGAESVGDITEFFNLYDINAIGCRSCLACKRKGVDEPYKCKFKDDLKPVLDKILESDRLIIGSPVYFSQPTASVRALLERLVFPVMSYLDYTSIFEGKVDVDIFLTMNAWEERYKEAYESQMKEYFAPFMFLNGNINIYPICDTLQVNDYSKYEMSMEIGTHKKQVYDTTFDLELEKAFNIGARKYSIN